MHEYSSVSASSYDPGALVAKLNEAAADGWDVVAIVPTGGDVSAFLRRGAGEATAEAGDPTGEMELVGATAVEEVAVEEPADGGRGRRLGRRRGRRGRCRPDRRRGRGHGRCGLRHGRDRRRRGDRGARRDEAAAAGAAGEAAAAVDEPAGWAVAPDSANDAAPAAEEIPVVATGAAAAAAEPVAAEPSPAPAPEPAPAPAPEPAPVVTTPAGWYPDPSTRYELRYWDGTQWTEHVARQGQQFTDPPVR